MRGLLLVLLLGVAAAGPVHFLTSGAAARAERRELAERLKLRTAEVRGLLARHVPPVQDQLERAAAALGARRAGLAEFAAAVQERTPASGREPAALRALAYRLGVDPAQVEPILIVRAGAAATADDEDSERRRSGLAAVLHAADEVSGIEIRSVTLARNRSRVEQQLPFDLQKVTLLVAGRVDSLVAFVERLLQGGPQDPPGDLVRLRLDRTPAEQYAAVKGDQAAPPLVLELEVDLAFAAEASR